MENDFLGTRYLAIIYDKEDLDQQRMYLDTYFNFLNDKYVIVLDFNEAQTHYKNKTIERKIYLYGNKAEVGKGINSDDINISNFSGNYKLIEIYNRFYNFLEENGYELIKLNHQQIDCMTNFLNIGNNYIISANKELKNIVKNLGIKIKFVELSPILNIGGVVHRITQVSRNISIKKMKNKDIKLVIPYIIIIFIILIILFFFTKKI
jgi:N-dimethylarginine dimethylaminohydrolase